MAEQQMSVQREPYRRTTSKGGWLAAWKRHLFFRRSIYGILFVAPAMIFFAVFSLYPMVNGLYLSLTDYTLLKPPVFVGFKNYIGLLSNKEFLNGIRVTAIFVLGTTVPKWIISLGSGACSSCSRFVAGRYSSCSTSRRRCCRWS